MISPIPGTPLSFVNGNQIAFVWDNGNGVTSTSLSFDQGATGISYVNTGTYPCPALALAPHCAVVTFSSTAASLTFNATLTSTTATGQLSQRYNYVVSPQAQPNALSIFPLVVKNGLPSPPIDLSSLAPGGITGCTAQAGIRVQLSQIVSTSVTVTASVGLPNGVTATPIVYSTNGDGPVSFSPRLWNDEPWVSIAPSSSGNGYSLTVSGYVPGDGFLSVTDQNNSGMVYNAQLIRGYFIYFFAAALAAGSCDSFTASVTSGDVSDFALDALASASTNLLCEADVPIQMKLETVGATPTVINPQMYNANFGKYSEDTTVRVTAVRCDTGATLPDFTGTVTLAEDGTDRYSQNGGVLPSSVYIPPGGGADAGTLNGGPGSYTFIVRSLVGPSGIVAGTRPLPAQLLTTNYPMCGPAHLLISQWITTGNIPDGKAQAGPPGLPYDWVRARANAIFGAGFGDATALAALNLLGHYQIKSLGPGIAGQFDPATKLVTLNPWVGDDIRLDSPPGLPKCGAVVNSDFSDALLHEARHNYQDVQAAIPGNDTDHDQLVNAIDTAPSTIFLDTTSLRTVCNESADGVLFRQLSYRGDGPGKADSWDAPDFASYALEMDAWVFATRHTPGDVAPGQLAVANVQTQFAQGQLLANYNVNVSDLAGWGPISGTVTVTETVPAGLVLIGMAGPGWGCNGNVCTTTAPLTDGQGYPPITVTVNVPANGSQINQFLVGSTVASGGGSVQGTGYVYVTVTPQ